MRVSSRREPAWSFPVCGKCPQPVSIRIKQRSRLHWWLAERKSSARRRGPASPLDDHDHITETAAANVLLVQQGHVFSPPFNSILGGVSLQATRELCVQLGIPFREQALTSADALAADEIWLCSTPYGIAGVQQINDRTLSWPGSLYLRLREAWDELVGFPIDRQILSNR